MQFQRHTVIISIHSSVNWAHGNNATNFPVKFLARCGYIYTQTDSTRREKRRRKDLLRIRCFFLGQTRRHQRLLRANRIRLKTSNDRILDNYRWFYFHCPNILLSTTNAREYDDVTEARIPIALRTQERNRCSNKWNSDGIYGFWFFFYLNFLFMLFLRALGKN